MRVLVLSDQSEDEGRRERLRAIAGLGCEVILGTPGGRAGTEGSLRLAPIQTRGNPADPDDLTWHRATIRKLITEIRPAVVHVEAEADSPLAAAAAGLCRKLQVPYVVFGWRAGLRSPGFFGRRRAAAVYRHASGVIGANRIAMEALRSEAPDAIATALPAAGVTLPGAMVRPRNESLVVGFAGRLTHERGPDLLVGALGETYGKWRLVVAGTGPEQEALEASIQRLGLASRVRWLGGIQPTTLDALWSEVDCIAVPSRDGPGAIEQPTGLLFEAMGRGVAPIVNRVGALAELVGPSGAVAGTQAELTESLQRWVTNPAECRIAGSAARQWVMERYVTSVVAARTLEFWQAVMEHAAAQPHSVERA